MNIVVTDMDALLLNARLALPFRSFSHPHILSGTRRLKEVVRCPARDHGLAGPRAWVELKASELSAQVAHFVRRWYLQSVLQMLVNLHYGGLVTTPVTVVGRCSHELANVRRLKVKWILRTREDGHHVAVLRPVVTLHDQLMCARDQVQAVVVVERLGNVLAKSVTSTSGGNSPSAPVVGVRPEQIAHGTLVGHLLYPVQSANVVKSVNAGGETAVETEDLAVDEGGKGKVVEKVGEVLPDVGVAVFAQALVVEAVDLGDLARFVVAAQDGNALRVANLQGNKEGHSLDGKVATVDIVTCAGQCATGCRGQMTAYP